MKMLANKIAAASVVSFVFTTLVAASPFVTTVQFGSKSATLTPIGGQNDRSYVVNYQDENGTVQLTEKDIHVRCPETCLVAPASGGVPVAFNSPEGLAIIAQAAGQKTTVQLPVLQSKKAQWQTSAHQIDSLRNFGSAKFDQSNLSETADQNPVPAKEVKPLYPIPITWSFAGGFGKSFSAPVSPLDPLAPTQLEDPRKTPGSFETFVRFPVLPTKDHHVGNVGVSFGYGFVRGGQRNNSYNNIVVNPIDPTGALNFTTTNTNIAETRRGLLLHQVARIDYETPTAGGLSGYIGGGLSVGHNQQTLINDQSAQSFQTNCATPYDNGDEDDNCVNTQNPTVNTHTETQGVNWSGVSKSFIVGLRVAMGPYATGFAELEKFAAGTTVDVYRFGVQFNLTKKQTN